MPAEPTFDQYTTLLSPANRTGQQFLGYLRNSIWVSTATTVLGVLVAVPAAYAFSRFSFPGREPLFFSVLVRNMFPVVVFLIPLFILMKFFGLIDRRPRRLRHIAGLSRGDAGAAGWPGAGAGLNDTSNWASVFRAAADTDPGPVRVAPCALFLDNRADRTHLSAININSD